MKLSQDLKDIKETVGNLQDMTTSFFKHPPCNIREQDDQDDDIGSVQDYMYHQYEEPETYQTYERSPADCICRYPHPYSFSQERPPAKDLPRYPHPYISQERSPVSITPRNRQVYQVSHEQSPASGFSQPFVDSQEKTPSSHSGEVTKCQYSAGSSLSGSLIAAVKMQSAPEAILL